MERPGRWRDLAALAGLLCGLRLAWALAPPLVAGTLVAAALEPQVRVFQAAARLPRWLAVGLVLALWAGGLGFLAGELGSHMVGEAVVVYGRLPHLTTLARRAVEGWLTRLPPFGDLPAPMQAALRAEAASLLGLASRLALACLGWLSALPSLLGGAAITLATAYLVALPGPVGPRLRPWVAALPAGDALTAVGEVAARAAYRLVRAELTLAAGTAAASVLLFGLLGSPYALLLGAAAGALDLVPYAGPALLLLPWAAGLALGGRLGPALAVAGGWAALAGLRALMELHLVGRGVGLSALGVLASLYLGGRILGPPGVLLGPVVAAAALAVWLGPEPAAAAGGPRGRSRPVVYVGGRWASRRSPALWGEGRTRPPRGGAQGGG